jgi:hypothetical protein
MNTPATTESSHLDALIQRINQLSAGGAQSVEPIESVIPPPEKMQAVAFAPSVPTSAPVLHAPNLAADRDEPFVPMMPKTLEEAGLSEALVEELMMRYLLARGEAMGRAIADQLQLPFRLIEPILNRLKLEQLTAYRGANSVNDYTHTLTDQGRDRARRYSLVTTYFGAAPVQLEDYCKCVKLQSVEGQHPRREQLTEAFNDLLIDKRMLSKLGNKQRPRHVPLRLSGQWQDEHS